MEDNVSEDDVRTKRIKMMASDLYAAKIKEKLKSLTECPICKESLRDARMLPCIHSFCLNCLKEYGKGKSPGEDILCPICRKDFQIPQGGFEEVQVNHFVNKLIDVDKFPDEGNAESTDASEVYCDHCMVIDNKEKATGYCLDCSYHLCATCLKKHKALKPSSTHKMFTLDKKPSVDELIKMTVNNCPEHTNHQIDFYCYDCKTTACVVCFVGEHKEHKCLDVKKSAAELRQETDKEATKLNIFVKESEEALKNIDLTLDDFSKKVQDVEEAITKNYSEMKDLLEKHYSDLLQKLKNLKNQREKYLHVMKDECEKELLMLESFQRYWNEVKTRGSPCDIVQAASNLLNRVYGLVEQHVENGEDREIKSKSDYYSVEFNASTTFTVGKDENMIGNVKENISTVLVVPNCLDFKQLLTNTKAETLIGNGSGQITGITIYNNEIFLVYSNNQNIEVRNKQNPATVSRQFTIQGMNSAVGIVYNEADSCLYVSSHNYNTNLYPGQAHYYNYNTSYMYIHKINTSDSSITGWDLQTKQPWGLSISKQKNLLVSYSNIGQIDEFNGSGQLIRSITLGDEITGIYHATEWRNKQFIISQCNRLHRVCLVDSSGKVIQSYGQNAGSGVGQLYNPYQVDVDQKGNILVADHNNNKVRILSSTFRHLGDVNTGGTQIGNPRCAYWDKENGRLLVASGGNVWSISKT